MTALWWLLFILTAPTPVMGDWLGDGAGREDEK
jgi:hypothetical protein